MTCCGLVVLKLGRDGFMMVLPVVVSEGAAAVVFLMSRNGTRGCGAAVVEMVGGVGVGAGAVGGTGMTAAAVGSGAEGDEGVRGREGTGGCERPVARAFMGTSVCRPFSMPKTHWVASW